MGFQSDAISALSGWLESDIARFDWPRTLTSDHRFENRPEANDADPQLQLVPFAKACPLLLKIMPFGTIE